MCLVVSPGSSTFKRSNKTRQRKGQVGARRRWQLNIKIRPRRTFEGVNVARTREDIEKVRKKKRKGKKNGITAVCRARDVLINRVGQSK